MRIGIFGGSFDPIHRGHVAAAEAVRDARRLDRLLLVPSARPPHKRSGCVATFPERVAMAYLAIEGRERLEVEPLEGSREGPSYTFDTVTVLSAHHPRAEFDLLVGADMLADLPRWHRAAELVARVTVVAFARPEEDLEAARAAFEGVFPQARLAAVAVEAVDVSSTALRAALARGEAPGAGVDPAVARYISGRGLYRAGG